MKPEGGACVLKAGEVTGTAAFADQSAHGGIFVALLGTDRTAVTDDAGAYTFHDVRPGSYILEAAPTATPGFAARRWS
jgi:hypothetical protein